MKKENSDEALLYYIRNTEEKLREGIIEDSIVKTVDELLYDAIGIGASDIHLEPRQSSMVVRYRIDGILHEQKPFSLGERNLIISRLKILSALDISQKKVAQDGKIRLKTSDFEIDMRISTFPSLYGEKMVIRLLDAHRKALSLTQLGFDSHIIHDLSHIVARSQGFFLVTGPTGSGKTTTLYALLSMINTAQRNVMTMEDPIECSMEGITQSQVHTLSGFTFATGLRSLLRQDPDVIMIGEIRDKETAQIAVQAALTGHLVLTTLHTNNTTGALTRLIEMGIEPFLINATLGAVLAQRLVRKLCNSCKFSYEPSDQEQAILERYAIARGSLWKAPGCVSCHYLGYSGREAITELLHITDAIREAIIEKKPSSYIQLKAQEEGLVLLHDSLISKLKEGIISLEEFLLSTVL